VTVTAVKAGYATTAKQSAAKAIPAAAFTTAPTPTITGTAAVGSTLTAAAGTWAPTPTTLSYQWSRGGTAISGATGSTYVVVAADAGTSITVTVTAVKAGYATTAKQSAAKAIPAAITHVSGVVSSSRVFDVTTTPLVVVDAELTVPVGVTLSIHPGVQLKIADGGGLVVAGSLVVNGTAASPVTFTSL
ncbi:hypothetical protein ACLQ2Q_11515, partial [Microbacterium sp. DT81.1]